MFRPMKQLEKFGKSLDDLEVNSVPAPFWRNRKTILGSAINGIIGVLVRVIFCLTLQLLTAWAHRDLVLWHLSIACKGFSTQFKSSR